MNSTITPGPVKRRAPTPKVVLLSYNSQRTGETRVWQAHVSRVTQRFVYLLSHGKEVKYSLSKGHAARMEDMHPIDWVMADVDLRKLRRAAGWPKEKLRGVR